MRTNNSDYIKKSFVIIATALFCASMLAEPSGGPYGPVRQKYDLPQVKGKTYFVAVDGKKAADGLSLTTPTTIEEAISRISSGDAIVMRGGVYRSGNLTFNQGVTIQPYADEIPVLKGTQIAKEWKKENDSLWSIQWPTLFPATYESWWRRDREEKYTPLHRFNNDVVFIDGAFLQSAGSKTEVSGKTFYVDYQTKTIYICSNPNGHLVEITAFRKAIFRTIADVNGKKSDGIGPKIYGLTITQYPDTTVHIDGFYPQGISPENKNGNDVKGTLFENCDISNCFRIGVFAIGDNLTIRHCKISNTTTEGLYIVASDDVLLEKNIFTANNIENITGCYPAAVKIFNQTHRVTCRDNLIIDLPNSNGVWYDVGNIDGVFVNNWVQNIGVDIRPDNANNLWPQNGFFFEISKGVTCAGNVFNNCGNGVFILNSSNAKIYQNTFFNSAVSIGRDGRSAVADHFGWHPSTGPDVNERINHAFINNLLVVDKNYERSLMRVWQPQNLCDKVKESPLKEMDYNIYMYNSNLANKTIINWSPDFNDSNCTKTIGSIEEMQKLFNGSSLHSKAITNSILPVFKSSELGNFQLLPEFTDAKSGAVMPENIKVLLGLKANDEPYIGAYPLK